jgi:hypothetical protein
MNFSMNKKTILPLSLSIIAAMMTACGGESAKINEDPNQGVDGVTSNTSCEVSASDFLKF